MQLNIGSNAESDDSEESDKSDSSGSAKETSAGSESDESLVDSENEVCQISTKRPVGRPSKKSKESKRESNKFKDPVKTKTGEEGTPSVLKGGEGEAVLYDSKFQIIGDIQALEFAKIADKSSLHNKEVKKFDCSLLGSEINPDNIVDKLKHGKLHTKHILLIFSYKEISNDNCDIEKAVNVYKKAAEVLLERGVKFVIVSEPTPIPEYADRIDYWIRLARFRREMWEKIRQKNVFVLRIYKLFIKRVYDTAEQRKQLLDAKKPIIKVVKDSTDEKRSHTWTNTAVKKVVMALRTVLVHTPKTLVGNVVLTNEDYEYDYEYESDIEEEDEFGDCGTEDFLVSNVTCNVLTDEEVSSEGEIGDDDPVESIMKIRSIWQHGAKIRNMLNHSLDGKYEKNVSSMNNVKTLPRLDCRDINIMRIPMKCGGHNFQDC